MGGGAVAPLVPDSGGRVGGGGGAAPPGRDRAPADDDPIAAGDADSLEPPLDCGRVPKLTEGLTTEDIGVLDGIFGGLRTQQRPSECKEAWPEAFERQVEPIAIQPCRIGPVGPVVARDPSDLDCGEPRRIGRH